MPAGAPGAVLLSYQPGADTFVPRAILRGTASGFGYNVLGVGNHLAAGAERQIVVLSQTTRGLYLFR